jgi:hypothetical protein
MMFREKSGNPVVNYRPLRVCVWGGVTWQNWSPLTEFPTSSSAGDQSPMPITLGTTTMRAPLTPDLAGRPTWDQCYDFKEIRKNVKKLAMLAQFTATSAAIAENCIMPLTHIFTFYFYFLFFFNF